MKKNIKKALTSFAIGSLLLTSSLGVASPQTEAATNQTQGKVLFKGNVTASSLNVRNSYTPNAKKIGSLKRNQVVEVLQTNKGIHKIKYGKGYGWVSGSYIKKQAAVVKTVAKTNSTLSPKVLFKGNVTASTLNVRNTSSAGGKRIGDLKKNVQVEVVDSSKGWYKIKFGKGFGWVSASHVKKQTPKTTEKPVIAPQPIIEVIDATVGSYAEEKLTVINDDPLFP